MRAHLLSGALGRRASRWTSSPPRARASASSPRWAGSPGSSRSTSAWSSGTGTTCRAAAPTPACSTTSCSRGARWAICDGSAVLARGVDLAVNDSLHPALLLAPALGFPFPVAQVYGENLWRAMEANLDDRAPPWVAGRYRRTLRIVRDSAFARIVHTLGDARGAGEPRPHLPPRAHRRAARTHPGGRARRPRGPRRHPARRRVPEPALQGSVHRRRGRGRARPRRLPGPRRRRGLPDASRMGWHRRPLRRRRPRRRALRLGSGDGSAGAGAELGDASAGIARRPAGAGAQRGRARPACAGLRAPGGPGRRPRARASRLGRGGRAGEPGQHGGLALACRRRDAVGGDVPRSRARRARRHPRATGPRRPSRPAF